MTKKILTIQGSNDISFFILFYGIEYSSISMYSLGHEIWNPMIIHTLIKSCYFDFE